MNIVEFIWHDLGDYLSCYGRSEIPSPHLAAFAEEGVVFDRHFCTAPQCSPSRATLMTGRYPHSNGLMGLTHRGWSYHDDERDLPRILNDAGFDTRLFGLEHEWHDKTKLGYTHYEPADRDMHKIVDKASAFFKDKARKGSPFFASIGFSQVHRNFGLKYDPEVLKKVEVPGFLPDLDMVRKDLATFYENIRVADEAVGRALTAIREAGLEDDTLVFFTTDHGPAFPRAKMTVYDPGIKIAFLMRFPGVVAAGRRIETLTSHVDVLPTLLEAAGVDVPENVQGPSFWPLLTGKPYEPRQEVFAELTWHGGQYDPMRVIRTERHKYVRNFIPGRPILIQGPSAQRYGKKMIEEYYSAWRPEEELYDLESDPLEKHNLAGDPASAATLASLRERLMRFLAETDDPLLEGDVDPPVESDYDCYWQMRKGAKFQLEIDADFAEYPFPD